MSTLLGEELFPLAQAGRYYPLTERGRKPSWQTVYRHALHGAKALDGTTVRLETAKSAKCLVTSREAVHRFIARLSCQPVLPPSERRAAEIARADRECEAAGI